ncbi:dephospho-CoA kinase [Aureimonas flava]|uniref:Dephospho-CoA kinase n=1 Tax=Aureimonas flava TaxID=2320271 RepID=A0A3A1WNX2_9HYPH|nr:dephospho-CoA kinase [Aureimonas flava]RIY02769.1 dephospho-CoA kinase [Aureimonas flava]
MKVLGLTGSIGMGKSTTAEMFAALGVPVHSADAAVHRLYAGRAAPLVEARFPGTVRGGVVDRAALGARVLGDKAALAALEAIVHPLVREEERAFLEAAHGAGAPFAVLDIPLLFETGGEGRVDAVLVVSASPAVQRARVLARPGMTADRFAAILASQMPDTEKRARADYVIDTGAGLEAARAAVARVAAELREARPAV